MQGCFDVRTQQGRLVRLGDALLARVLVKELQEVMLVLRVQQVQVEKGFGTIRAANSKDVAVYTESGQFAEVVGMRGSQRARESARADETDDDKGSKDETKCEAGKADGNGNGGGEQDEDEMIEVQRPANKDTGSKSNERDDEAGEAGTDHTVDATKVFGREVAHGNDAARLEDENTPAVALATGQIEAEQSDAGDQQNKGAIAQDGEQGVLPFQIRCERMGIRRPEKDGAYSQQGRAKGRQDDQ